VVADHQDGNVSARRAQAPKPAPARVPTGASANPAALQLLALQRGAGNRAATLAVQRRKNRGKKAQDPFELVANTKEQVSAVNTGVGGGLDANTWTGPTAPQLDVDGNALPPTAPNVGDPSVRLGFAGPSIGVGQGLVGTVGSSIAMHTARKERKRAKLRGHKAGVLLSERQMRMAGGDIGKNVTTIGSGVADLTSKGLNVTAVGSTAASTAGVVAGGFAAPLATFNMLRDARKTAKAWNRCIELERTFQSWDEPRATIEKMQEQFTEAEAGRAEAETKHAEAKTNKEAAEQSVRDDQAAILALNAEITRLRTPPPAQPGMMGKLRGLGSSVSRNAQVALKKVELAKREWDLRRHQQEVQTYTEEMAQRVTEVQAAVQVKADCLARIETSKPLFEKMKQVVGDTGQAARDEAMKKAKGKGQVTEPSLLEIQAYAYQKNNAGRIKKLMSTIGGALGAGGATAGLALAIAGLVGTATTIAMASPIGWALAAGAAVFAIGLGLYKGFKWLRKRWGQAAVNPITGAPRTTGARLAKTLAVWTPAGGQSRREQYGKRLLDMSLGVKCYQEQMLVARTLVADLIGRPWLALGLSGVALSPPNIPVTAPTAFAPTTGGPGASTGLDSGANAHEGINTSGTQEAAKGGTLTLPHPANLNYKAAKELIVTKMGS
jgi:hypothetical protein